MEKSSGEPLTRCPVCRYDLTGLPASHRCPECAFEYDETTRVWTGLRGGVYRVITVALLCIAWIPPLAMVVILVWARSAGLLVVYPKNVFWLIAGSVICTVVALLPTRWRPIVLLDRHGIVIRNWRGRLERFPWHEIWLAPPGTKVFVPPWVVSETQLAAQTPARRWWTVFTRGGFRIGAPSRIYLVGKEQWKHVRYSVDFLGFGLSAAQRRGLMAEIYRRWVESGSLRAAGVDQPMHDA